MPSTASATPRPAFDRPLAGFVDHPDLPLHGLLSSADVQQACDRHAAHFGRAHNSLFSPALTLWAWLAQALFADKSAACACARVTVLLLALARPKWSEDTGTYCRARARLPAPLIQELAQTLAD